jgi:hypothetical protein
VRVRWRADAEDEQVFFACVCYGVFGFGGYIDQHVFFNRLFLGVQLYGSDASCYVVELCGSFVKVLEGFLSGFHGCQCDAEGNVSGRLL